MLNLLALLIGTSLTALLGWLMLRLIEGKHPILQTTERVLIAIVLGQTMAMLAVFIAHWSGMVKLTLTGFLAPILLLTAVLALLCWRRGALSWPRVGPPLAAAGSMSKGLQIALILLLSWSAIKMLAGGYDLARTPTYWDDSFNNWNMRGKIFFVQHKLVLEIPVGNGVVQSEGGVGSYPLSVPLTKTWLSVLRGSWQDALVNSVHFVWFLCLIGVFFYALRRSLPLAASALGVYVLVSLPLLLIHGANPYAEVIVAVHLLIACASLYEAARTEDPKAFPRWFALGALAAGLMVFVKNEALLLFLPILLALAAWVFESRMRRGHLSRHAAGRILAVAIALLLVPMLPWLAFKFSHNLSFGNAKYVSDLQIRYSPLALRSLWLHFTQTPNWLFAPLLLPLAVLLSGKRAWRLPLAVLTVFVAFVFTEQMAIYIYTPLATEAIRQTGVGRGVVQIAPVTTMLGVMLGWRLWEET